MRYPHRSATVVTHMGEQGRLVDMPWLGTAYHLDGSDSVVLSAGGWQAVAEGDPAIWEALERKLLIGFYVTQPQLIAVVGHPGGRPGPDTTATGHEEVRRIVRRVRALLLPAAVLGFWMDEEGRVENVDDDGDDRAAPAAEAAAGARGGTGSAEQDMRVAHRA